MFTIRKAVSEDFERVYPILGRFGDSPIPKEVWKKIFVTPWKSREDFCGYLLLHEDKVKGYLGVIFSERILNGEPHRLCNMTSWIVDEDCRDKSLLLLLELLKLKDFTLTNFTASETVAVILRKLGFKEFPVDQRVLLPIPGFGSQRRRLGCDYDLPVIKSRLTDEDLRIFNDHQGLNCQHLLLHADTRQCYVILKKTKRKGLTFAKVHYLSRADVFHECLEVLVARICLRLGVFGLMVDERYVVGHQFRGSVRYPHQRKGYFKSKDLVNENLIDTIYSELVVLHN